MWAAMDDTDRAVALTLMSEISKVVPTVPGLWMVPGPVGSCHDGLSAGARHGV